eukprot:jgi/Tetstr1/439051/TSEL_027542.t1
MVRYLYQYSDYCSPIHPVTPALLASLSTDSYLVVDDQSAPLRSEDGVRQGAPLATTSFCVAIHPEVQQCDTTLEVNDGAARFNADDGFLVGLPEHVWPALHAFRTSIKASVGLEVRFDKMQACNADMEAARREAPADIEWPELDGHHGIAVLNVPLGSPEYVQAYMRGKAEELREEVDASLSKLLSAKPSRRYTHALHHHAWAPLKHCMQHKAGYWLRNCLPSEVEAFAEAVDATILAAVERVLGVSFDPSTYGTDTNPVVTDFLAELLHDPDPMAAEVATLSEDAVAMARSRLHLPTRLKGAGIRRMATVRDAAFIGCMNAILPRFLTRNSGTSTPTPGFFDPQLGSVLGRGSFNATSSARQYDHFLNDAHGSDSYAAEMRKAERILFNQLDAASGMWTVAIPTARTAMTPHELREVAAGDELKDLVSDAELSLPAFNVVAGSCDPRSLKSTLLEFKTMRYGVKYTSVPRATAVDRFERSLLGDIQRGLAARDAAWHNTESGQKGPLRDILDMSEYTGMVFGTVGLFPDMAEPMDAGSDGEGVEVQASEAEQDAIMELEEKLAANPRQLGLHTKYIELLRKVGLAQRLRSARQALRELAPLSVAMWREWVGDEAAGLAARQAAAAAEDADSDDEELMEEDRDLLGELYEAACGEFLCVDLWLDYFRFTVTTHTAGGEVGEEGVAAVRAVGERALAAGGLHVSAGAKLWQAVLEYEQGLLEAGWEPSKQVERVRELYHRQLAVPLAGMADTMAAYSAWEQARGSEQCGPPAHVQKAHEAALAMLDVRLPLEEKLAADSGSEEGTLSALLAYLRVEEATLDAGRIRVLYERALAAMPARLDLWSRYATFAEENLKVPADVLAICRRAARAVPSSGHMWARYLGAAERVGASVEEVDAVYTAAMSAKLKGAEEVVEVVLARCDFLRRQGGGEALRRAFAEGREALAAADAKFCDPALRLPAYEAHCELQLGGGPEAARAVWENALKGESGRLSSAWQAYAAFERSQRNLGAARALYKRCYARKLEEGGQVKVCQDWLRFEREEGSAEEQLHARLKCQPMLDAAAAAEAAKKAPKQLSPEEMKAMRRAADPNFKDKPAAAAANEAPAAEEAPPAKRPRTEPAAAPPAQQSAGAAKEFVAFVKNLSRTTNLVGLTKFFTSQCPELKDIRMPLDHVTAKPRGLAYVEFESAAGLEAALRLNGAELDGHTLIIVRSTPSRSQAPGGGEAVEYVAFCRNLAFSTTEDALAKFFAGCPGLKGIRLPLDHATGRVRGIGYVEFEAREGLDAALGLNGQVLGGRPISIEESKPPGGSGPGGGRGGRGGRGFGGRGGRGFGGRGGAPPLGGGGGRRGGLGYGPQHGAAFGSLGGPPPPQQQHYHQQHQQPEPFQQPMSNDQFRNFFLGGGGPHM